MNLDTDSGTAQILAPFGAAELPLTAAQEPSGAAVRPIRATAAAARRNLRQAR
jgi:hypothetical protein